MRDTAGGGGGGGEGSGSNGSTGLNGHSKTNNSGYGNSMMLVQQTSITSIANDDSDLIGSASEFIKGLQLFHRKHLFFKQI